MGTVIRMPALAAGATEAAVQAWLVAVGDRVEAGQEIVEIETEKAVVEHEADVVGVVAALLVEPGVATAVGAPIAVLAEEGESTDDALAAAGVAGQASTAREPDPADAAGEPDDPRQAVVGIQPPPAPDVAEAMTKAAGGADVVEPIPGANPAPATSGRRLFASPLVRRLAQERGIDLSGVTGSGPNGRIVRRDLDDLAPPDAIPAASAGSADEGGATGSEGRPLASDGGSTDVPHTDVPHTGMRRAIARRLTESTTTVPHFFLEADCAVDELLELRARINTRADVRISVNDFVVKAVAAAMIDVPEANAIWTEAATRRFATVDLGVAVSIPGGLITPVVRGVESLTLTTISRAVRDLADRARAGRLRQQELEGGSFAVSNLGMYGTSRFSAIINPPHAGILAVGAAEQRPVVDEQGELSVATVMTVTLSADHRVLDGALAAQWLAAFTERIQHPLSLLV